jgi:hypothetical protein
MSHLLCITIQYKKNACQDLDFVPQFGYHALEILAFRKLIIQRLSHDLKAAEIPFLVKRGRRLGKRGRS